MIEVILTILAFIILLENVVISNLVITISDFFLSFSIFNFSAHRSLTDLIIKEQLVNVGLLPGFVRAFSLQWFTFEWGNELWLLC